MTETVSNTTNALVTIPVDTNNLIHVNGEQCIRAFLRRATGEVSVGDIVIADDIASEKPFEAEVIDIQENDEGKPVTVHLRVNWANFQKENFAEAEDEDPDADEESLHVRTIETMLELRDNALLDADIAEWVIDQATIARRVILDNRNEKETLNPPISLDEE